jgi:hypothetical protein
MERHKNQTSNYVYIKQCRNNLQTFKMNGVNSEIDAIDRLIHQLRSKCGKSNEDITEVLKNLEFYLPLGNNDKEICQHLYYSKLFIGIIEALNTASDANTTKLLGFIERFVRGNRYLSKYLSRNICFVRKVFKLMMNQVSIDINAFRTILTFVLRSQRSCL